MIKTLIKSSILLTKNSQNLTVPKIKNQYFRSHQKMV